MYAHAREDVVIYASRKLKIHEKNYPTLDLDLVVVVFALNYLETLSLWCTIINIQRSREFEVSV